MTFGLTFEKLILIGFIAVMIIGPARLPVYAAGLRRVVDRAKVFARSAEGRIREELGPEFTDTDWRQLDPRRFDPRRIVREALIAEPEAPTAAEDRDRGAAPVPVEPTAGRRVTGEGDARA
ncbi:sec-independent protein translocase protein TatB [Microbacterium sp. AG1240]|uniref:Sec-independent protein translocase TatB n=1 Tax=Microbacterium sp. AG1240 TaxID=2183992 RepID=UPI000EAF1C6E|nr:Sec-independent protein translocase TatB [Microbacterium sp. AG1240]RKT35758.1 sec-independent protein translocase protein TatB [Microbacterium sp. AG1240]